MRGAGAGPHDHGPGGGGPNGKLIGIIAAAVVVLAGIVYGIYSLTSGNETTTPPPVPQPRPTEILAQSITVESSTITLKEGEEAKLTYSIIPDSCNENVDVTSSKPECASCEDGVIKGIKEGNAQILIKALKSGVSATVDVTVKKKGGEAQPPKPEPGPKVPFGRYNGPANGLGGTITVTRNYALDLHDDGEPLQLSPGDEIQQTKFTNGELRGGVWVHNGSRRSFTR